MLLAKAVGSSLMVGLGNPLSTSVAKTLQTRSGITETCLLVYLQGKEGPTETVAYSIALPLYAFGRPASILAY